MSDAKSDDFDEDQLVSPIADDAMDELVSPIREEAVVEDVDEAPDPEAVEKPESFRDTIKTVFYAILIALCVRTVAYEPFNIPSGSMIPTLLIGDYLFPAARLAADSRPYLRVRARTRRCGGV